jgi:deazaflavin-dependent oxidoreductase (nitroreductase family)
MAKTYQAPYYVRVANLLTTTLLRAGVPIRGPYIFFGKYRIYLLMVRGRKSGQMRRVPIALLERNGKRYVASPFGRVNWALNLRAAGEARLLRGHKEETVVARELPSAEAALVMREEVKNGHPFAHTFGVTADSSLEEFERAVIGHSLFELESN